MNSLMQLSRALNDARLEKEAAVAQAVANAKAEKMEAAADERQEQLIKVYIYNEAVHASSFIVLFARTVAVNGYMAISSSWKRADKAKKSPGFSKT